MTEQETEKHRPKIGQRIYFRGDEVGTVKGTSGSLCGVRYREPPGVQPFIWRLVVPEEPGNWQLNNLYDWPGKPEGSRWIDNVEV
jgi:hypothetical protein